MVDWTRIALATGLVLAVAMLSNVTAQQCTSTMDLVFLVDSSGSICENDPTYSKGKCNNWVLVVNFVSDIIDSLSISSDNVRVGLVLFSTDAQVKWTLDAYTTRSELSQAVRSLEDQYNEGWTNTADGLLKVRTLVLGQPGDRSNVGNVVIIITDGIPTRNEGNTSPEATLLKSVRDTSIYVVGITQFIDEDTLRMLSSSPQLKDQNYFTSPSFGELGTILQTVITQTCQTTPAPQTATPTARPTPSTRAPNPAPTECTSTMDLVFLVDSSGSICENDPTYSKGKCNNWVLVVNFVSDIIDSLSISSDNVRVGLALFSTDAQVKWTLDAYTTRSELSQAVRSLEDQYNEGWTNTADGLLKVRTLVLGQPGDRSNVGNVVIIITDGIPTRNEGNTSTEATLLKSVRDTSIYVVGITQFIDEDTLRMLSSSPQLKDQNYFTSPSFGELGNILQTVITQTCQTTPAPPTATPTARPTPSTRATTPAPTATPTARPTPSTRATTPAPTECSEAAIDLVFVVDSSGSICENDPSYRNGKCDNWVLIVGFVHDLVDGLSIGDGRAHVGLVLFSTQAEVKWTLDRYMAKQDLLSAVRDLENQYSEGWTNTADGLSFARTRVYGQGGDRSDVDNVMFIITDGIPTRNEERTQPEAIATRDANIKMYSVGITRFIDEATLQYLSSPPQKRDENYFISPDFQGLSNILDNVLTSTCQVVTPAPTPAPTATPTARPTPSTRATTPAPTECSEILLDLAFIVDGSGSICENDPSYSNGKCDNWRSIIDFMERIVDVLGVDGDKTRVGLVLFSTDARLVWTLDRYKNNKAALVTALRSLEDQYPEGWTNTADAFAVTRSQIFGQLGDRSNADNLAIIITDGIPTRNEANAIPEAQNLQNSNVKVYAIGITQFIDENTLSSFSSQPRRKDQEYFSSPDFSSLNNVLASLLSSTCVTTTTRAPSTTTTTRATPTPECSEILLDLAFIVDGSGSICENDPSYSNGKCDNWRSIIDFMERIVDVLGVDGDKTRVGLVLFSTDARLVWTLDRYKNNKAALVTALRSLEDQYPEGWTNTADAFAVTRSQIFGQLGDRSNADNLAIIITDGIPTRNEANAIPEAQNLQNSNVKVYAIGITKFIDENTLSSFSSLPRRKDQEYFSSPDFSSLNNVLASLLSSTCVTTTTRTPSTTTTTRATPTPASTPSSTTTPSTPCGEALVDMALLIDGSGSICENDPSFANGLCDNWRSIINFIISMVDSFSIDDGKIRVALVLFSTEAELRWNLERYNNKNDLVNAMRALESSYPEGWTNTADGFSMVRTQVFNTNGDRSNADNIVVIITDGIPTRNQDEAVPQANNLHREGVQVFAIGITNFIDENTLKEFSSSPQELDRNYFKTPNFSGLENILSSVISNTVGCTPTPTPASSTTTSATTTRGSCTDAKMDLVFIVDGSNSVCETDPSFKNGICDNWKRVVEFMVNIVNILTEEQMKSRVAVIVFSDVAEIKWYLDRYTLKTNLLNAINNLQGAYPQGWTNTAAAFLSARTEVFYTAADRNDAPNIVITITDGLPTRQPEAAVPEAILLRQSGAQMYAIGVTDVIDEDTLKEFSSNPQQKDVNYFLTPDFNGLRVMLDGFIKSVCGGTPTPSPVSTTPTTTSSTTTTSTLSTPSVPVCSNGLLDIAFIVDGSSSICQDDPSYKDKTCDNWKSVTNFLVNIVNRLDIGNNVRVALVLFSNTATTRWNLDKYFGKTELVSAIQNLNNEYPEGFTNTADGFDKARTEIFGTSADRSNAPNLVFIITDGIPTIGIETTSDAVNNIKSTGVTVYAIGITEAIDEESLRTYSSPPHVKGQNYFTSLDFNGLNNILDRVVAQTENCPTTPTPATTTTTIKTTSRGPGCENANIDLAFILDGSGSVCDSDPTFLNGVCDNWKSIIQFMVNIVSSLTIDSSMSRVAVVIYSDNAAVKWTLDRYATKTLLLAAIQSLTSEYPDGWTNTAEAFKLTRTEIFGNGADRPEAENIVIIITDGFPTRNPEMAIPEAKTLQAQGVRVYAIGITSVIDENTLRQFSSAPQEKDNNYFVSPDFSSLTNILDAVLRSTCVQTTARSTTVSTTTRAPPVCSEDVDLVLVVDGSGSICENDDSFANGICDNWVLVIQFLVDIVNSLSVADGKARVGLVLFSTEAEVSWTLDRYGNKNDIANAIRGLSYPEGWTNTADALLKMRSNVFTQGGDRSTADNVAIIVTDGVPTRNMQNTMPEADAARAQGIRMYSVGITKFIDEDTLKSLSSSPQTKGTNYFTSPDFSGLQTILNQVISSAACATPSPPTLSTPTTTTTKSPTPSPSTTGPSCQTAEIDLAFIVDSSGSICENDPTYASGKCNNWILIVDFMVNIVNTLTIGSDNARVGLVLFSTDAMLKWTLDRYTDKSSLINAIRSLEDQYSEGWTNTADALAMTRTQIFSTSGDRSGVPNIAIVITDGIPTRNEAQATPEAVNLRNSGVMMYAIGITRFIDENTLKSFSSTPQEKDKNYFISPDFSGLQNILEAVLRSTCGTPAPTPPPLTTTTTAPTSPSSTPTTSRPTSCEDALLDLAFLVDSSGSICENDPSYANGKCDNWVLIIDFMVNIANNLGISGDKTRVALVMFSTDAETKWRLDEYIGDSSRLTGAIRALEDQYSEGWTNTADGLMKVRTEVFGQSGDRSNAENLVIIITDGIPTRNEANTIPEATSLRNTGASMYAVGITGFIDEETLKGLSSSPQLKNTNYFTSPDFSGLDNILGSLLSSTCGVTPTPTPSPTTTPRTTTPTTPQSSSRPFSTTSPPLSCEDAVLDLTFVVDGSGSICENDPTFKNGRCNNWVLMINFMNNIVDTLSIDMDKTRVALVLYSTEAETKWTLDRYTRNKIGLQNAIRSLETQYPEGWTNTADALLKARTEIYGQSGDRSNGDDIIIIVTDGIPTRNEANTEAEAQAVHAAGIKVYAVGITQFIDEATLKFLSSSPQEKDNNYFISPDFNGLQNILDSVLQRTCGFTPSPTTTPTPTTKPPTCVETKADLVFVVDGSGSICENDPTYKRTTIDDYGLCDNWVNVVTFVASITQAVTISDQRTRVGLVLFSSDVTKIITLDQYSDKTSLLDAIQQIKNEYPEGWTNTADAFRAMRLNIFSQSGDRSDAENIAIVITDGVPTRNEAQAIPEAEAARAQNIKMYAIGITQFIDESYLKGFSSLPQELTKNYFITPDFSGLGSILDNVLTSTCGGGVSTVTRTPASTTPTPSATPSPTLSPTSCPLSQVDLTFVIDSSSDVCDGDPSYTNNYCESWGNTIDFVWEFINLIPVDGNNFHISIVMYSTNAWVLFPLDRFSNKVDVLNAIMSQRSAYPGGSSNIADAILLMRTQVFSNGGDRSFARNVGILVIGGQANINDIRTIPEAQIAQRQLEIYAIGITGKVSSDYIRQLSSQPQSLNTNYYMASSYNDLRNYASNVKFNVCNRQLQGDTCRTDKLDLVFVLDSSGSICDKDPTATPNLGCNNWRLVINFMQDLARNFEIGSNAVQVGLVQFANHGNVKYRLNQLPTIGDLVSEFDVVKSSFPGGNTNTFAGLRTMRLDVFTQAGDRNDAPNVAILITDGYPTTNLGQAIPEAQQAHADQIIIFGIGITNDVDVNTLKEMSSPPHELNRNYLLTEDFEGLDTILTPLLLKVCEFQNT